MDKISSADRSRNMRLIRSKNTRPEIDLRKLLYSLGYRYRLHVKGLPGKPDMVFTKRKIALFVNGCFWHSHDASKCSKRHTPKSNTEYWHTKLERNRQRDIRNYADLEGIGWKVVVIWECEIESVKLDSKQIIHRLDQ